MQDIHSIGGGGGGVGGARLFGGVGGGGDRRLRPHSHHLQNNQALKCPRCDSLNTKFCYYNNYNLSQPRHFCKSCRRYWTKGGVLRNVPVGGGCRKTKHSKSKQAAAAASSAEITTIASQQQPQNDQQPRRNNNNDDDEDNNNNNNKSSNSHSSSESSSLTATNTTTIANTTIEAVSSKATPPSNNNNSMFKGRIEVETSKLFSTNPSFEQGIYEQYPDIGGFTGLMSTSSSENMHFGFGNLMNQQTSVHEQVHHQQQQSMWQGGFDQTVQNELTTLHNSGSRGGESGGGFGALDWQGSGDQGLFDIPNAVDQAYWSQNQWSGDQDHHLGLYLP